jgi:hypothetical protein
MTSSGPDPSATPEVKDISCGQKSSPALRPSRNAPVLRKPLPFVPLRVRSGSPPLRSLTTSPTEPPSSTPSSPTNSRTCSPACWCCAVNNRPCRSTPQHMAGLRPVRPNPPGKVSGDLRTAVPYPLGRRPAFHGRHPASLHRHRRDDDRITSNLHRLRTLYERRRFRRLCRHLVLRPRPRRPPGHHHILRVARPRLPIDDGCHKIGPPPKTRKEGEATPAIVVNSILE